MNRIRIFASVLVPVACALASGCAASNDKQSALKGPGKDLARQWAQAAKQPADAESGEPAPEPKLLPLTHFSAGNLYEKQGHYVQAIEQYRKAVGLNASFAAAYGRLGLCYTKVGQYDLAIQALRRACDLQAASPQLWNNLGYAYMARQNYRAAEEWLGKAVLARPGFARARLNMAITLVQLNRDSEALGHLLAISAESVARYNLGTMQLAAGRPSDARASFERALSLQSDLAAARKGLDEALAQLARTPTQSVSSLPLQDQAVVSKDVPAVGGSSAPAVPVLANPKDPLPPAGALQAKAGPTTRPIAGVDDEPALANVPAQLEPKDPVVREQIVPIVVIDLPTADSLACVQPVVFTDDIGQPLRWSFDTLSYVDYVDVDVDADGVAACDISVMQAAVCYLTSRQAQAPQSVADLDLASLRWAAWTDAVAYLDADVDALSSEGLRLALSKWQYALNELEFLIPNDNGATAYADDW
jgi:Flp pilus assembly protein TadD